MCNILNVFVALHMEFSLTPVLGAARINLYVAIRMFKLCKYLLAYIQHRNRMIKCFFHRSFFFSIHHLFLSSTVSELFHSQFSLVCSWSLKTFSPERMEKFATVERQLNWLITTNELFRTPKKLPSCIQCGEGFYHFCISISNLPLVFHCFWKRASAVFRELTGGCFVR